MKGRAQRRYQREKALKRAMSLTMLPYEYWSSETQRLRWAYHHYQNPKRCSCPMCGNPRRHAKGKERYTLAERKLKEKIVELNRNH